MDIPLQIEFRNMDRSEAIEARVRERSSKLERFFDHIVGCRVAIEAPHRHQNKGTQYHVRIIVDVPGKELVVSRDPGDRNAHEDVNVAIRDAFAAAQRQVEDHVRKLKGQVKAHETPPHGRVARLFPDEGYGFVELTDGQEVYFHRNAVVGDGFDKLEAGAEVRVEYTIGESEKGAQATTVQALGKHHIVE
jgi:cold shock CspA family protein/ribosome-associated translation inhibitor RaiA